MSNRTALEIGLGVVGPVLFFLCASITLAVYFVFISPSAGKKTFFKSCWTIKSSNEYTGISNE